jgi:hypothetical protein
MVDIVISSKQAQRIIGTQANLTHILTHAKLKFRKESKVEAGKIKKTEKAHSSYKTRSLMTINDQVKRGESGEIWSPRE